MYMERYIGTIHWNDTLEDTYTLEKMYWNDTEKIGMAPAQG